MHRSAVSLVRLLPASETAPADAHLLRTFASTRSDDAFGELVRRHGPMVLATCRRVLGDNSDAEDAFQAVFLVLARKANTVRGNLAGWLYAVAVRTARGVRVMRARRRKHETRASLRSEPTVPPESDHDLARVIDEELACLPAYYREALVLCELRGLSRKEAAVELGVPEGTLASRLAAAKRKLAALLSARGLTPAALVALLAPVSVSASLVESAALAVRGTAGPVASAAASAVVKAMLFEQLKAVTLAAGILLTVVCGGFAMTGSGRGEQPAPAVAPAPRLVDDPTAKLVEQLGAPEFADREAAQKKLRELGMKAESALKAGHRSEDPEVRNRSAKILSEIRKDALAALVKGFDPAKADQPDHPVWKRFVAIAGDSKASRELFARIIANEKWLRTLDKAEADPANAGHVYRVGIAEVFRDYNNDSTKSPFWPCDRPEEVAYLMLLGSHPDPNPPAKLTGDEVVPTNGRSMAALGRGIIHGEGQIIHANGVDLGLGGKWLVWQRTPAAAGTDRVFAKLFAAWLAQRPPSSEVVPRGFLIASGRRLAEVLPLARRYAANDFDPKREVPPLVTIAALGLVAQLGTRADLPLFERHFGDKTNVAAVDKPRTDGHWDYDRPAPLTETTQMRDVALGLALLLYGENPEDFGFVVRKDTFIKQKDGRYTIPWAIQLQLHLGFKSDEDRTAAFKKAKAWLAEQKKVEPPVAPKPSPEVEDLVKQLAAPEFAVRENAAKQLRALGVRAEPALKAALKSDDPEIRQRASKILAEIRSDALDALVKEFDPAKEQQPDHPLWRRFRAITGDTRAARDLFAGIIKNPNWLRRLDAAEANPDAALRQYQEVVIEVGKHYQSNMSVTFHIPVWPCDRGEEAAFLLLLGSYPNTASIPPGNDPARGQFDAGEGRIHFARGLELGLQGKMLENTQKFEPEPVAATAGTDRVFAKLFAAWLEHREPAADVVPDSLWLAAKYGAKEVLPFARMIAADKFPHDRTPPRRLYAAALAVVARFGTREDLPLFEKYCKAESVIATFELEDGKTGSKGTTQLRDAAFGLALVLHGEDPAKYGFVIAGRRWTETFARTVVGQWDPCAFGFLNGDDDKARLAAHAKVKAFLDKQPKIEPKPNE